MTSDHIGELVMEGLRALDGVAYVRFASVYKNFRDSADFGAIVDELQGEVPQGEGDQHMGKTKRRP